MPFVSSNAFGHASAQLTSAKPSRKNWLTAMLKRPDDLPPDRHRRHRQRAKAGRACYVIELDGEGLSFLIRTGWLLEGEADDRQAIGRALSAMVQDAARR